MPTTTTTTYDKTRPRDEQTAGRTTQLMASAVCTAVGQGRALVHWRPCLEPSGNVDGRRSGRHARRSRNRRRDQPPACSALDVARHGKDKPPGDPEADGGSQYACVSPRQHGARPSPPTAALAHRLVSGATVAESVWRWMAERERGETAASWANVVEAAPSLRARACAWR
jgi:hypothetical protein